MLTVGIDIGTSFSSIAFLNENTGEAETVKVESAGDKYAMPSAIFVEETGAVLLGQAAVTGKMRDPASFKAEFKRDLGQDIPYTLGNCQLLPEELYKEVFIYFKKRAEENTGEKIGKAYVTYPANYNKRKKQLIEAAARKAGLLDVELIDEPSAAAFCYFSKGKIKQGDRLLIYDFGGGTFDTALVQYSDGVFKPLTEAMGLERCGGIDIDNLVFEDILSQVPAEQLQGAAANATYQKRFYAQVMEASNRIKHQLSSADTVREFIPVGFDTFEYTIGREKFNGMIQGLVEETMDRVRSIIGQAGVKAGDIAHVVAVGGSSRIPYVRERLQQLMGKQISADIDADLAICRGAALMQQVKERSDPEALFKQGDAHYGKEEYEAAFECFRQAAEAGYAEAQTGLGFLYLRGEGVQEDREVALSWFHKAAEHGNAHAQYTLGSLYANGKGVKQDPAQAAYWMRKAADQGDADAQDKMGMMYFLGQGVTQDFSQARAWFLKAAEAGNGEAQYNLGALYENGYGMEQDLEQAVHWFQKAADRGDADAQLKMGELYENGEGMEQDYYRAAYWYQKSAEQGNAQAQYGIASMYVFGAGIEQDHERAIYWFQQSADQGFAPAQHKLGVIYDKGLGVEQDDQKAAYWYQKSADQGDPDGQRDLGALYAAGRGVPHDHNQAMLWSRKSAEQGDPGAQYNLGMLYMDGPAKDLKQAVHWFQESANQGNAAGQYSLSACYAGSAGVAQDFQKAFYWCEKAADQGDADAQFDLGRFYEEGKGVTKDLKKAAEWFRKAADGGNAEAQCIMGNLYYGKPRNPNYIGVMAGMAIMGMYGYGIIPFNYNEAGIQWAKAAAQGHEEAIKNLKLLRKDSSGKYVKS